MTKTTEPTPDYLTDDSEWTMEKLKDAMLVDVIHMRYEWLYQFGNLGISADDINKSIKRLEAIEERVANDKNN